MLRYVLWAFAILIPVFAVLYFRNGQKPDYATDQHTLAEGKTLFRLHCSSCHGLEQDGIGPRIGGVTKLLSRKALTTFIKGPDRVLSAGDQRARALQARYKLIMPPFEWMGDTAIHSILSYIAHETERFQIDGLALIGDDQSQKNVAGRLVPPVKKSGLRIELEDVVRIPRLKYSTPDLGIATLRPHPSGDGRLFVSDQGGIIYEINSGQAKIFMDLRTHIKEFSIGPGIATGLGSFDFHPDFPDNGLLYITHAEKFNGQPADYRVSDSILAEVQWVLSEWKVSDVNAAKFTGTRRELLRLHAPTYGHGAQDLGFIPGLPKQHPDYGLLYWGFGDGGSNNIRQPELGHHLRSFLGTVLRIDPRGHNSANGKYGIPADNPFASDKRSLTVSEIWAYGFRNPHRMSWDPGNDNRMMVTDIGESNVEEINVVEKGGDYGWPSREGDFGISTTIDLKSVFRLTESDLNLYKRPFVQYDHLDGNAISGGYVYEGDLEKLKNKYVFGDIVNGKLFYINIDKALTDSAIYELTIVQNGKETSLRQMSRSKRLHLRIGYDRFTKNLYVITKSDGMIRRVSKVY
jgi:mono/diheme cytochrome c family protein